MRGVYYKLKIKKPDNQFDTFDKLNMKQIIENIKESLNNIYCIDGIKVNNQIIYNLMNRPNTCNPLLKNFCYIEKL